MLRRFSAAAAMLALVGACSPGTPVTTDGEVADVVVGSFDFAENEVVAEIYAQALEGRGLTVERQLALGPRELVLPAIREGLVDVVPEYAGSALRAVAPAAPVPEQAEEAVERLRTAVDPWELDVLAPAAASNQNVVVVRAGLAAERTLRTIADLAPLADRLILGGPAECADRPLCLPGLRATYGLDFRGFVPLDGPDQVAQALADRVIDVGVLFSTDAVLADDDVVALSDVRGLQPPDPVVPLARRSALTDDRVAAALDAVSAALTTEGLRFLSWRVAEAGTSVAVEARGWLVRHGLVER